MFKNFFKGIMDAIMSVMTIALAILIFIWLVPVIVIAALIGGIIETSKN